MLGPITYVGSRWASAISPDTCSGARPSAPVKVSMSGLPATPEEASEALGTSHARPMGGGAACRLSSYSGILPGHQLPPQPPTPEIHLLK